MLQSIIQASDKQYLEHTWAKTSDEIINICNKGIAAGTHSEFWEIHNILGLPPNTILYDILHFYKNTYGNEINTIEEYLRQRLTA